VRESWRMDTHEFDRTVLGLRVTFLRVLASVRSMTRSHRLCSNKSTLERDWLCTCSGSAYVTQSNHICARSVKIVTLRDLGIDI
jgi:hypothetical protein